MSQQYEYPPPPPPPRSPASIAAVSGASFPERRRAQPAQPPSLATNLARSLGQPGQPSHTPISAATLTPGSPYPFTPGTPVQLPPRPQSLLVPPGSPMVPPRSPSMEPYNPRQWSSRQPVSGSQMVFSQRGASAGPSNTREATGMEAAMPSPPPPYSAESGEAQALAPMGISPLLDTVAFTASPAAVDNSTQNSPQVPMSPAFPPPPGQSSKRERSSSGQRGFFSLSNLRGKQPAVQEPRRTPHITIPDFTDVRPPASRRAVSAGQLQSPTAEAASPARRPSPESGWQPGMPLPGPPPGPPPPAGTRTQSLNRYPESSSRSNSQSSQHSTDTSSRPQRRTMTASSLGPIPPTPADWVDPDATQQRQQEQVQSHSTSELPNTVAYQPLRIDTGSGNDAGLARRPAKRDQSLQGLRERRSQSRANRESVSDRVFSPSDGSISQRREHTRNFSAQSSPLAAQTQASNATTSNVLTPPYTPAVGTSKNKMGPKAPDSASSDRPISHLLHQPVDDSSTMPVPLTPQRPASSNSFKSSTKLDAFYTQAIERHRKFVEQEANANSDEERLELFANFMVNESRLRRDRYTEAYNAMAGDIVDLTRDMWRSFNGRNKRATPSHSMSSLEHPGSSMASDGQPGSAHGNGPSSASSFGDFTPITDGGSIPDAADRQWGEAFKPSLSPIPSMNVSSVRDDDSSRGRTASRWWEDQSGSGSVGRPDRMEKTHRETKYMGIKPGDLHEEHQPSPQSSKFTGSTPNASANALAYGPDEYPPEKVGWHENMDYETPQATPNYARERKVSTPAVQQLDVSRLVTLPPPYPRHHPAISNNHPLMTDLRNEHRILSDQTKIREIKDAYIDQDYGIQREQEAAAKERRSHLRASVQEKIADGTISFAEAAQAEMDFDQEEAERGKANARSNFDLFEASMSHPLNGMLTGRLEKANACIAQLRIELESRNEILDPNQAQEEGDEQPERLEKLTLLKWLFECREQLHKEMFDLHAERSTKYSEVILTPYRIAKMQIKIDEATSFFSKDSQHRQSSYAKDALKRYEELQQIVDTNVSRGVEDQLSAFWDIAPGLLAVIQAVPGNVADLEVQIPDREYEENPAYNDYPLQYLYSLLSHAQRSAYQFIESQTNLLCLLHEVRTATMKAKLRLREVEGAAIRGLNDEGLRLEMAQSRNSRERELTADLKEKVGEVERQWREALGSDLEECRERVKGFLVVNGGWEDGLDG